MHPLSPIEKLFETGIVPHGGAAMHRLFPEIVSSAEAGRSVKHRLGGNDELRAAARRHFGRMPWPTDLVIYQPAGQGFGEQHLFVERHRLAEAKALAERSYPEGLASWTVRPFCDGEDRFARVLKTPKGDRNALLDPVPVHPMSTAPIGTAAEARAPPD